MTFPNLVEIAMMEDASAIFSLISFSGSAYQLA